ncbi:ABC transporter ATP-binding protein [Mycoplasma miroungirhinis]|uniref:ABC transporter ATP-binding protein n=1 Tax=Mycoplasma miroungirhinis TaxID=754516 RepID=A0A6M4JAW3_9MOLU|nr:ABC transporter ATP-binding protein [Mycoplasma miroungirhinis]QJR44134.1 ABC transporter ATP-binding protein [Mycoplasma miroungirhinis]
MKTENLIEINDLEFKYEKKSILNINKLDILKNKITVLLGPSGSGKTTLLNLISGFLKPTKGKIEVLNNPKIYEIGYIMQEQNVYPNISVFLNVYLSAKNTPNWVKQKRLEATQKILPFLSQKQKQKVNKIINLLKNPKHHLFFKYIFFYFRLYVFCLKFKQIKTFFKILSLKEMFKEQWEVVGKKLEIFEYQKKKTGQLSGGQKQRVAFAKAIIKNCQIIILDEPFSALDAKIKENTIKWIASLQKEFNLSMIMVTHDQQDAMKLGDKIILMNDGHIVQNSSPEDLYNDPQSIFVAKFIGFPEINLIKSDENYDYYIRHNKITMQPSDEPNAEILSFKHLGDSINYTVLFNDYKINILSKYISFFVGEKIKISFDDEDVFRFSKEGNRVYKS